MAVSNKLSSLSKLWKSAKATQSSFSNVADGDYTGALKEMKLEEAKKSGRLQVTTSIEIVDGDYAGKVVKRFDGLDNETSVGYFKGLCEIIGFDIPEDVEVLQEALDEFIANNTDLFNITIKSNDKYSNVYVNGVSDMVMGEEGGEEAQEEVQEEEAQEEVQEEEVEFVEEEEEVQEVAPPKKKVLSAPTKKVVVAPAKKVAATAKKVVTLRR